MSACMEPPDTCQLQAHLPAVVHVWQISQGTGLRSGSGGNRSQVA